MKSATLEEIVEVSQLAKRKLEGREGLLSHVEYDQALFSAMQSIASDRDLNIFSSLIMVDSPQGIDLFERHAPTALSAHLFIRCEFSEVRPWVEKLCSEDRARSLIFHESGRADLEAGEMASRLDNVPVFIIQKSDEITSIISRLESNPHEALKLALNGEQVALRFLEGNPT